MARQNMSALPAGAPRSSPAPAGKKEAPNRREHILEQAAKLFAAKGVAYTTVRDIAEAAGILSGSLYYHFSSKEAIFQELIERFLNELVRSYRAVVTSEREPRARLEQLLSASFETIDQYPHLCEIFQNDFTYLQTLPHHEAIATMSEEVQSIWLETITSGVDEGTFRSDVDPQLFYRFARDAVWFTVRWYHTGGPRTPAELSAACTAVLLDGFVDGTTDVDRPDR